MMAMFGPHVLLLLLLLLLLGLYASSGSGSGSGSGVERGRIQLRRVQNLATQPRYGDCWARALEHLDTRCKDLTSESQRWMALRFAYCHLNSSGRDFPACPEGSEVSKCAGAMDAVAFNTYTEFFTHTQAICHFLQSEAWQSHAEDTVHRLTESSAGVAEQLQSSRQLAQYLVEAQGVALQAQQEILNNGEELRLALKESTQGLHAVFSELSSVNKEQQVVLSDLFNRVSFLQSFVLMEAHSLSSCSYNAAAFFTTFLLTSTQRSSRARLVLLTLVCVNFYLERRIYQFVLSSGQPEHKHMELLSVYVSVQRHVMVCVGGCVLLYVCVRHRDPLQQSLQLLQQLRETQHSLQVALQHAEGLGERQRRKEEEEEEQKEASQVQVFQRRGEEAPRRSWMKSREEEEECSTATGSAVGRSSDSHNPSQSPGRCPRSPASSSSPQVYSILVEDRQPRYSLRSRRSEIH